MRTNKHESERMQKLDIKKAVKYFDNQIIIP